jgi:hypothetical protein
MPSVEVPVASLYINPEGGRSCRLIHDSALPLRSDRPLSLRGQWNAAHQRERRGRRQCAIRRRDLSVPAP